jgi:hypothetical protein
MGGGGKAPEKTNQQRAMERRQKMQLDQETASSERRLKAVAQKQFGKASLLGTPIEQAEAPEGPTITEGYMTPASGVGLKKKPLSASILGRAIRNSGLGIRRPSDAKKVIK